MLKGIAEKPKRAAQKVAGKVTGKTGKEKSNGIKKEYLKTRDVCKVTFRVPREAAPDANRITVVGDFNGWNTTATPMRRLKSGEFTATVELEPRREYQYRYLIDEAVWENDWYADKYVPSPYGDSENSVVVV